MKLCYIVNAYLTAWYQAFNAGQIRYILDENISIIKRYHIYRESYFDVLVGIQIFLFNHVVDESKGTSINFIAIFNINKYDSYR